MDARVLTLLDELQRYSATVAVRDGQLVLSAPRPLPPALIVAVRQHKPALLAALTQHKVIHPAVKPANVLTSQDLGDDFRVRTGKIGDADVSSAVATLAHVAHVHAEAGGDFGVRTANVDVSAEHAPLAAAAHVAANVPATEHPHADAENQPNLEEVSTLATLTAGNAHTSSRTDWAARAVRDPLVEDTGEHQPDTPYWEALFTRLVAENGLAEPLGVLRFLRRLGAQLTNTGETLKLVPPPEDELSAAEYQAIRQEWLMPHHRQLTRLFREVATKGVE